jgi:hypothetical protein
VRWGESNSEGDVTVLTGVVVRTILEREQNILLKAA